MVREDLYAIVAALVDTNTCCTRVLTYYFVDDSMLKRNAEETRPVHLGVLRLRPKWSLFGRATSSTTILWQPTAAGIWDGLSLTVSIKDLVGCKERDQAGPRKAARSLREHEPRHLDWLKRRVPGYSQDGGLPLGDGCSLGL
ncbi:hypothetical protein MTO96_010861 [Rhipicephalus appendiculatus]